MHDPKGVNISFIPSLFDNHYLESFFVQKPSGPICMITENVLADIYGENLKKSFGKELGRVTLLTFPGKEENKTRKTKEFLEDQMLEKQMGRDTHLIAFGGGIVLDLVGHLASTYMRGISLYYIPTTLLSMVDVAVGGKTGVNTEAGKNLIGTYYLPKDVLIDCQLLNSLPANEWRNGFAEVIKHAILFDEAMFFSLEKDPDLSKWSLELLRELIEKNIHIKKCVVSEDFYDVNKRQLLNFGHTIGHALERMQKFSMELSHGEAVLVGMVLESYLSWKRGRLPTPIFRRIKSLIDPYEIWRKISWDAESFVEAIVHDKKSQNKTPFYTEITGIGTVTCNNIQKMDLELLLDEIEKKRDLEEILSCE